MEKKSVTKKTWDEFRACGLLWWINSILHIFGWALVVEVEDGKVKECYPSRVIFRGWDEDSQTEGFKKVTGWIKENIAELENEANT